MASSTAEHVRQLYQSIYAVVRRIPRGQVATYGQIAELAGIPGGARVAGAALKTCKPGDRLPWQRVIGKAGKTRGRIAIHDPVGAAVQRQLLGDEGVDVGDSGLISLPRYGWLPGDGPRRTGRRAAGKRVPAKPPKRAGVRATRRRPAR
jgi:methylated-DNA-protein-cysteine methyltransferase related protein